MAKEMVRVPDRQYRTIYGAHTNNVCAMCFSKNHMGALTVQNMKQHHCLKKNCDAFVKFTDHPYWAQRKLSKLRAKGKI
jgi:hypothetical protein